ncbi:MAG: hypothetical protein ACFCD0_20075 [Gemmataceae bacterium]
MWKLLKRNSGYKIRQEALQILVVGVVVGLAAVIIPTLLSWNRERFERHKESRQAYSHAQTGMEYLPERLAGLDYVESIKLMHEVHVYKHVAETDEELEDQLRRQAAKKTDSDETDKKEKMTTKWSNKTFQKLEACKKVVSENPGLWDNQLHFAKKAMTRFC